MDYIAELRSIFSRPDLYQAHEECAPVMNAMAREREFFFGVIRKCLSDPEYLDRTRHYPTLAFPIEENEDFTLVLAVFDLSDNMKLAEDFLKRVFSDCLNFCEEDMQFFDQRM